MEEWTLNHPTLGQFRAFVGHRAEIREIDPGFPRGPFADAESGDEDADPPDEASVSLDKVVPEGATQVLEPVKARTARLRQHLNRDEKGETLRLVVMRDGVVVARMDGIKHGRVALRDKALPPGKASTLATSKPRQYLEIDIDGLSRYVATIRLHDGETVANLEPPADSPAAKRMAAMEESKVKAVLYPLLGGLGKSGWALCALFLGPLIGRFLGWLLSFLPDVDIPWPTIHWPHIDLPSIPWPRVDLPDLPSIPWPHVDLPPWLTWLLEHPKVWTPVILAIVWGIAASRKNKKSAQTKAAWEKRQRDEAYASVARALRARQDQLGS